MENIEKQPVAPATEDKEQGTVIDSGSQSLRLKKEVIRTLNGDELNGVGGGMMACTWTSLAK